MKLTKKRTQILHALQSSQEALTAKQLHAQLPEIDLVTIYRGLDAFVEAGTIKRLSLDGGEAHFEFQHEPHHHAVCVDCDRVIHFTIPDQALRELLPLDDFAIEDVELTVRGNCGAVHKDTV